MSEFHDGLVFGLIVGLVVGVPVGVIIAQNFLKPASSTSASSSSTTATSPRVTYKNLEEWDVIKDPKGRVTGVRAHRTATEEA